MLILDHLAIVCADLQQGVTWAQTRLGVSFQEGGKHAHFGTHNALLGLADGLYLEVIAPDPDARPAIPRWFGLDHAPQTPRLGNWICQTDDLQRDVAISGPAIDLARGELSWQITVPDDGSLPLGGAFPTLIKWGAGVPHPASTLAFSGLRLVALHVYGPTPDRVMDPRVTLHPDASETKLCAEFETISGQRITL